MLQLRNLLSLHSTSPLPTASLFSLYRLLSTTAAAATFAVEDYLVAACGLTRPQAHKASKKISHLRSPSKPDAVLAFLSAHGLSPAEIAALVSADPKFLCADVEKNLAKRVAELGDLGLSRAQIARLIPQARRSFRYSSLCRNLGFWLPVFGTFEKLLRAIKVNGAILSVDLEKVAKPNLALLQQCGINARDFSETFVTRVLTRLPEHVLNAVAHIDKLGVPRSSPMFRYALTVFALQSQERLAEKIGILEMLGWSQDDVLISARKMPGILTMSEERLRRNVDFLTSDVGLEIPYIVRRPVLVLYSLECRLLPRYRLLKVLNGNGLLDAEVDFYTMAALSEKKFLDKFVHPYEKSFPGLAVSYASSCAGKVQNVVNTCEDRRELQSVPMLVL